MLIRQLFLHDPDFIDDLIGNYRSKANWAARLHQLDRIEFEKFPQNIVDYGPSNRKPIDSADATYTQTSGTGIRNPLTNYRSSDPQQVTWAADYFEHRRRIVSAFNTDMDLFKFTVETHPMAKAACEEYMQKNGYTAPGQYVGGIPSSSTSTRPKPKIISMLESRKLFKELIASPTPVLLWESKTARQARVDANNNEATRCLKRQREWNTQPVRPGPQPVESIDQKIQRVMQEEQQRRQQPPPAKRRMLNETGEFITIKDEEDNNQ